MKYIRSKYGNDGYATWFTLLEQLANADDHHIECTEIQMMLLAGECGVSIDVLESIIADLVVLNEFQTLLWNEKRVLFSERLRDSIVDAYRLRTNQCITTDQVLEKYFSTVRNTVANEFPTLETTENRGNNTQSKVKQSKVKQSKENQDFQNSEKSIGRKHLDKILTAAPPDSDEVLIRKYIHPKDEYVILAAKNSSWPADEIPTIVEQFVAARLAEDDPFGSEKLLRARFRKYILNASIGRANQKAKDEERKRNYTAGNQRNPRIPSGGDFGTF